MGVEVEHITTITLEVDEVREELYYVNSMKFVREATALLWGIDEHELQLVDVVGVWVVIAALMD